MLIEFSFNSTNGTEYDVEITARHVWIKAGNRGSWRAFVFHHPMNWDYCSGVNHSHGIVEFTPSTLNLPDDLKQQVERYVANKAFI